MTCVDLKTDTLKILSTHFSCNEKPLHNSNKYSTSTKNMKNEKSYTKGKNYLF